MGRVIRNFLLRGSWRPLDLLHVGRLMRRHLLGGWVR